MDLNLLKTSSKQAQCAIVNTSVKIKLTNSHESPIVSKNALLSLVAFVRRLHEHRDSSNSGGLDDCPKRSTGTDNLTNKSTAETPYRNESRGGIQK
jgi:hypothetical protein